MLRRITSVLLFFGSTAVTILLDRLDAPTWLLVFSALLCYAAVLIFWQWPRVKRRLSKSDFQPLPTPRPYICATGYAKDEFLGGRRLLFINDGATAAYDLTLNTTRFGLYARVETNQPHHERVAPNETVSFPLYIEERGMPGYSGEYLFSFMQRKKIDSIQVSITYRDSEMRWFQTTVTMERDVAKAHTGGFKLMSSQKLIDAPKPLAASAEQ